MPPFPANRNQTAKAAKPGALRFLVVDDDPYYAGYLGLVVRGGFGMHCEIDIASSVQEAMKFLNAGDYDICFLDYSLPPGTGMDVLRAMAGRDCETAFIFVTSNNRQEDIEEALKEGASNYLLKARISPFDLFKVVSDARLNKQGEASRRSA